MAKPILTLHALEKQFGSDTALHPTTLTVEKGEFLAMMGPSGCGKSTTLRMIAGLEAPSAGQIRHWDRDITNLPPWERDMPMVWQSYALFPFMTVRQNVEFGLKQKRRHALPDRRRKAGEWLERLDIAAMADRRVNQLSGGQRQRVALARALALEPEILLLDEPLSALDAHLRLQMQAELKRLHGELGITFLYVTHSQSEAFAMADRVAILNQGHLQQIGSAREVYRAPANRFVAEFVGASTIITGTGGPDHRVETAVGTFTAKAGHPPQPGQLATVLIPSNAVTLSATETGAENAVTATFLTEEFTGSFVTLYLLLADQTQMKVQLQQSELDRITLIPGDTVHAHWPAEAAYVLKEG
ncbi:ABC transporter ATP-binding protein [Actibacterium sp. 188UL27-1]|uniref:ABC transporter ATP-binding protein n=1 Tax=Actibacterium sp. 188UL27-1 TaxID=2786961 RepID=UPI00195D6B57|nr:ABC transporter ATP-binding protein [Actibacterium sp. 188UL27-1]MBM7067208.1 ABC transporter ATP-binding protein [Actibacterium sp. 188UL27-1]